MPTSLHPGERNGQSSGLPDTAITSTDFRSQNIHLRSEQYKSYILFNILSREKSLLVEKTL